MEKHGVELGNQDEEDILLQDQGKVMEKHIKCRQRFMKKGLVKNSPMAQLNILIGKKLIGNLNK